MKREIRLMALGIAVAVNGAALMVVNAAMLDGAGRQLLAQQEPQRIVITGSKQDLPEHRTLAVQNCPDPRTL
jgi:hypothetical protein